MNQSKYEPINPRTNVKNIVSRTFWGVVNKVKYSNTYFFDTNILVGKPPFDKRIQSLRFKKNIFVSSVIKKEVEDKISAGFTKLLSRKTQSIDIDELRSSFPEACPLYYNFFLGAYSPAIINSPTYLPEGLLARLTTEHEETLSKPDEKIWQKVVKSASEAVDRPGLLGYKDENSKIIDAAYHRSLKKKRKSYRQENYIHDSKNIALSFLYAILNKSNVTVVTADYDLVYHSLNLVDHIIQQMAFMHFILIDTTEDEKKLIASGRQVIKYVDKKKYDDLELGLRLDVLARDWKKGGKKFEVKFWHTKKQKYFSPLLINMTEDMTESITRLFGGINCPQARNIDYGNWIKYHYEWLIVSEGKTNEKEIKFTLNRAPFFVKNSFIGTDEFHDLNCYMTQLDNDGELAKHSVYGKFI